MGLLAMLALGCKTNMVKIDPPKGKLVCFSYTRRGTIAQPYEDYELKLLDNGTAQLYAHNLGKIHDTVSVNPDVVKVVQEMIISNEIYKYEKDYKPPFEVMDGESWHYSAEYDDGTSLSSGGFNARPKNFALPLIVSMLDSIAVKAGAQNKGFTEEWFSL